MRFNHIAIVGVGLIGGSFALAARRASLARRITGWGGSQSLASALDRGIIDGIEDSFNQGSKSVADFVYLSAPVGAIIDFLQTKGKLISPNALVTDAGSTKREICRAARESLSTRVRFVGGHPMTGSHEKGVEFARADLFDGAPYAIVTEQPGEEAQVMSEVARAIGAKPLMITPDEHDRIVARVSHAPQLLSTALAASVAKKLSKNELKLSGSGLADMTRLAQSDWSVWKDILSSNADNIAAALDEVIKEAELLTKSVESQDTETLSNEFTRAGDLARLVRGSGTRD